MSDIEWQGVFPAVTTKFTEDDRLDVAEIERHIDWQIESGVHGIIVCGSLGENGTLDGAEKREIVRAAVRAAGGRVPVVATCAESSTRASARFAEDAAKEGAKGLMVLPGIPYRSDARETVTHYRAVARAGALPVMIYNNPVAYGVAITPAMLAEMAEEPAFVAVKESSDDIRRLTYIRNLFGNRYRLFAGVDDLASEMLLSGTTVDDDVDPGVGETARDRSVAIRRPALCSPPCAGAEECVRLGQLVRFPFSHGVTGQKRQRHRQILSGDGIRNLQRLLDHVHTTSRHLLIEEPFRGEFARCGFSDDAPCPRPAREYRRANRALHIDSNVIAAFAKLMTNAAHVAPGCGTQRRFGPPLRGNDVQRIDERHTGRVRF